MTDAAGGAGAARADFATRLVAFVVDYVVLGTVSLVAILLFNDGLGFLIALLAPPAYYTWFEGSPSGQTPGKRLLGIRVVDAATGRSIGHGHALVRSVMRIVSAMLCWVGYLWMLWDPERQTWHDKVAGSVVVPATLTPPPSPGPPEPAPDPNFER